MKWSWKLGRIAGVDLYIHATFLLLVGWVALSHWLQGRSVAAATAGVAFILALFSCVVLHELGHALAAKKFGIKTRDITLLPIGGAARLERMPEDPKQELAVAVAGPAVSLAIAAALFVWLQLTRTLEPLGALSLTGGSFLERLMVVNLFLALFNLLPAFPMDGGRVLRAALAMRMDYARATQVAAVTGQAMALVFGFIGFFANPFLLFIALFVWLGAAQEATMVQMKSALAGIPVSQAMMRDIRPLSPTDTLSRVVELTLAGSQQEFPVEDADKLVGVLTRRDLLTGLSSGGQEARVGEYMQREFETVDAGQMLDIASIQLQSCDCHTIPVTSGGKLVGLLTMENVGEFIMLKEAIAGRKEDQR
jgi:Zn-dependent protease/CBS domain-containing protein